MVLQHIKCFTPHFYEKQKYEIKIVEVVLELFKLAKQPCNNYARTVNFLQTLMFVRAIKAHYGVIYVTFATTPFKIIDIVLYSFIV